eukprot:scaffold13512_cov72-Cyclotella_meneghiniana.AAC.2
MANSTMLQPPNKRCISFTSPSQGDQLLLLSQIIYSQQPVDKVNCAMEHLEQVAGIRVCGCFCVSAPVPSPPLTFTS